VGTAALEVSARPVHLPSEEEHGQTRSGPLAHHFLIVPGVVLTLALPWLLQIDNLLWTWLVAAQLLLCAIGIVGSYATGLRPLGLVLFSFFLSWLGVGPLYQLSHRRLAWGDSGLLQRTDAVTAALGLTFLMTFVTSVAMWRASAGHRVDPGTAADRPGPESALVPRLWAPWSFLALLAVLTPYVIVSNGGLGSLFASRSDRTADLSAAGVTIAESGGAQVALVVILPVALSVAATHLFILRIRQSRGDGPLLGVRLLDAMGFAGALLGMVLFANPISNTRFISIAAFGSVALAVLRPRSPLAGRGFAVTLVVMTLAVYPLSDLMSPDSGPFTLQSALSVFAGKDFDGFQQIINSIDYVQDHGHTFGRYLLSTLLFFVPRSLWNGKATPSAIDVAEDRGYWFTNLSMPIHSEIFIEFGVVGLVLFAWFVGRLWSRMDDAWLHRPASRAAWLVPYLCMAELGAIRGPLGSLAPVWVPVVLLLAVAVQHVPAGDHQPDDVPPTAPAPSPSVPVVGAR
jgi:hypothetical protein